MAATPQTAPWYVEGLSFACTQCGNCCSGAPGYVWVSPAEIRAIAELLQMHPGDFLQRHTRAINGRRSLLEHEDGDCEFLVRESDGKTRCAIHPARPLQCRTWPFWKSNLRSRSTWDAARRNCPGINQGMHHPLPVIQQALDSLTTAGLRL